ncbi:MAG: hypothetical protein MI810_25400 [Flavobacteriales bacterium]|nr:hypothetical protein [Flavobacteriales bacterium]
MSNTEITYTQLWDSWKLPTLPENYKETKAITEKYFRSLYQCFIDRKDQKFDVNLLLEILQSAPTTKPAEFNPDWNEINSTEFDNEQDNLKSDYELALQDLQFFIADYRRLIVDYDNTPDNEKPFYQFESPMKYNTWYNFDIWSIVFQVDSGMYDHHHSEESYEESLIPAERITWRLIPESIHMGIIYE